MYYIANTERLKLCSKIAKNTPEKRLHKTVFLLETYLAYLIKMESLSLKAELHSQWQSLDCMASNMAESKLRINSNENMVSLNFFSI